MTLICATIGADTAWVSSDTLLRDDATGQEFSLVKLLTLPSARAALVLTGLGPVAAAAPGNKPPRIRAIPTTTAVVGHQMVLRPRATDPDGPQRALRFRLRGEPRWVSFSTKTGILRGKAPQAAAGKRYRLVLSVTDGRATRRERREVLDEQVDVERVRMVPVHAPPLVHREVPEVAVVRVHVDERHRRRRPQRRRHAVRDGALAGPGAARDPDDERTRPAIGRTRPLCA